MSPPAPPSTAINNASAHGHSWGSPLNAVSRIVSNAVNGATVSVQASCRPRTSGRALPDVTMVNQGLVPSLPVEIGGAGARDEHR